MVTAEVREDAGLVSEFPDSLPTGSDLALCKPVRYVALLEHPAERLRLVWQHRIMDPLFRQQQPRRFAEMWLRPFGDFVRWVMRQDPLAADVLVRPQWAMLPEGTETVRTRRSPVRIYSSQEEAAARLLYPGDFDLWDSPSGILDA